MDKNELLDLLVSVRERNIDIDTAANELCALAEHSEADSNCNLQRVEGSCEKKYEKEDPCLGHSIGGKDYD